MYWVGMVAYETEEVLDGNEDAAEFAAAAEATDELQQRGRELAQRRLRFPENGARARPTKD